MAGRVDNSAVGLWGGVNKETLVSPIPFIPFP